MPEAAARPRLDVLSRRAGDIRRTGSLRFLATAGLVLPLARLTPDASWLTGGTAEIVLRLLGWGGIEAVAQGSVLRHGGGFAYEIAGPCLGLAPMLLVICAVAVGPDGPRRRSRALGCLVGGATVWLVNLLRLVALFAVGAGSPRWFAAAHELGQLLMVVSVAGFLLLWLTWVARAERMENRESLAP